MIALHMKTLIMKRMKKVLLIYFVMFFLTENIMSKGYTLSKLKKEVDMIQEEVGCDGEWAGSHKCKSTAYLYCEDTGECYFIKSIEPSIRMGCGCWDGIVFNIRKYANE